MYRQGTRGQGEIAEKAYQLPLPRNEKGAAPTAKAAESQRWDQGFRYLSLPIGVTDESADRL